MQSDSHAVRDISYASSASTRAGRGFIRTIENATGRLRLIRRAAGYQDEVAGGRDFWEVMARRFGVSLDVVGGSLSDIPRDGPLIVIANHPYGILDGLMMGHLLAQVRGDFRILANSVFRKAGELEHVVLPVDFSGTRAAREVNVASRRAALDFLDGGGCVGIFPGGTVSTAARPFGRAMDPAWRPFTARMIQKSGARIVPVFFDGSNSRRFQIASHVHVTLRMAFLISEFRRRVDEPVRIVIGKPLSRADISRYGDDARGLMAWLRAETYGLSPRPIDPWQVGYDYEERRGT